MRVLRIPTYRKAEKKKKPSAIAESLMAAGEGFEPSHTESESAVLPLHNPAVLANKNYYTHFAEIVNTFLHFFWIFLYSF